MDSVICHIRKCQGSLDRELGNILRSKDEGIWLIGAKVIDIIVYSLDEFTSQRTGVLNYEYGEPNVTVAGDLDCGYGEPDVTVTGYLNYLWRICYTHRCVLGMCVDTELRV